MNSGGYEGPHCIDRAVFFPGGMALGFGLSLSCLLVELLV